ncbi:MAG: ABC transporter permease [Candidatus Kariarchaeaceae archaeon]|jgi:ABC-type antimicrobial peptide transport system permease subunit
MNFFVLSMFFSIRYALKSINRRKKKNIAAVLAVALGVTLLAGVNSGSIGMQNALASTWWSAIGDVDITIVDPVNNYFPAIVGERIESSTNFDPLSGLVSASAAIRYYDMPMYANGSFRKDIRFSGINPQDTGRSDFLDLNGTVIDISSLLTSESTIISEEMAKLMDIKVGDTIHTVLPNGNGSSIPAEFTVKAIFDDHKGRGREGWVRLIPQMYANLVDLQNALIPELQDYVNRIDLIFLSKEDGGQIDKKLENLNINDKHFQGKEKLEEAVILVEKLAQQDIPVAFVWSERVLAADNVKYEVDGIKTVLNLFVFMLTATALLLIINVQSMGLEDRRNQTAILRAMGSSRFTILRIFLIESSLIGAIGSFFGLILGYFYGAFIQYQILTIFDLEAGKSGLDQASIIQGFIFGIALSVLTAVLPAYRSSGMNITAELRGIPQPVAEKTGKKTIIIGLLLTSLGLLSAQNVGNFWEKEAWSYLEDQVDILLGLGLTIAGLGMLLTVVLPRRLALNISGFAIWGLANFSMFVAADWVEDGNGNNWLVVILMYLVIGSTMLVIVNFDQIMMALNKVLFFFSRARSVAQITTTQMVGKKSRSTLVFTIFTLILVLNVFLASTANTMRNNLVNQYEWRSHGIDLVVDVEVPSDEVTTVISDMNKVEHVFAFRSVIMPVSWASPEFDTYDAVEHTTWMKIVEIPEEIINPNDNWDETSFPISFDGLGNDGYSLRTGMTPQDHKDLSITILEDFFAGRSRTYDWPGGPTYSQVMTVGGFFSGWGDSFFLQGRDGEIPAFRIGSSVSFTGNWDAFAGSIMITEEIASQLREFDNVQEPNLFLVRSSNSYFDETANLALAQDIEKKLNKLDDPDSLSYKNGVLMGATTRLVQSVMQDFWDQEADVWDFLSTFSAIGLVIGAAGMIVIAARSVSERTREIGMMRAIGFSRSSVVSSVILEMTTLALMGLISGVLNGVLITEMFSSKVVDVEANYPLDILGLYTLLIMGVSFIAAIVPGIRASRIAPSQALRYTG